MDSDCIIILQILMKPVDYGLSSQPLSDVAERNLRIVATTLLYLVRRIAVTRNRGIMVENKNKYTSEIL